MPKPSTSLFTIFKSVLFAPLIAVLGLSPTVSSAAPGDIDLFSTDQAQLVDPSPADGGLSSSAGEGDSTILGGSRDISVELLTESTFNPNADAKIGVAGGAMSFSVSSLATGIGTIQWDGPDGDIALDPVGLGGVDLTGNGFVTEFEVLTLFSDLGHTFVLTVWSDADHWTEIELIAPAVPFGSPETSFIQFSDFTNCAAANVTCAPGGAADITSLGALQLEITSAGSVDMQLDSITTTVPPLASLGDRVWNDLNADGDQDCTTPSGTAKETIIGNGDDGCTEPGIGGVTVNLYGPDCAGNILDSMPTDADGFYLFDNLAPGTYCVEFDKNSAGQQLGCRDFIGGVESSPQDVGDDTLDSDANPLTGQTGDIDLLAGDNDLTNDAGFYCPAKIGDMLVDDRNRDGIQGDLADEPGVEGQEVKLVKCVGGVPGTTIEDSQFTDPDGMYMFNPLPPGEYAVIFSKPPDTEFSPQNVPGDETKDCDTNVNGVSDCVTLGPDEYNQDVDACINIPPVAGLGDFVWEDLNVDGQQDGEPGIPGVTVNLLRPGVDDLCNSDDDEPVAAPEGTTTTDANGKYLFENLQPGRYCVEFDINSLPDDFCTTGGFDLGTPQFTLHNTGADDGDSDADTMTGKTGNIDLGPDEFDPTNDAGIYCPAKIGDRVWEDTDKDGLQDDTEEGVPNVTVNLYECTGGVAIVDNGKLVRTTTTDSTANDMNYMFGAEPGFDLPPGDYFVQFIKPDGTEFTTPDVPADDGIDSDCLTPDGVSECITVGSRGINLTRDCGIIPPPPPECDLIINKTCRVETPPPPTFDKCQGKLQEFTVIWTGGPMTISGELSNYTNVVDVATNQEVTFTGPFSQNDVFVNIAGTPSGESKFHMSCSDDDFNSPDDCGKAAGDGKGTNDGFINAWKLEGFVDNDGTVLDCTSGTTVDFPVEENCEFTQQPANCDISGKPTSLTFLYSGAGCGDSNNAQDPSKAVCTGDVNGLLPVTVVAGKTDLSNPYTVAPVSVAPGEMFTMSADKFDSNSRIDISNAGGTESNLLHLSCSQPLAVGDKYGSLELVGFNDVGNGVEVLFGYEVTNNGDPVTGVTITDNILGHIAGPFNLDDNIPVRFTRMGTVTTTTTNVATASGLLANEEECKDTDEVTVEVVQPVTPVSCSDIKDITAVSVVWDGSEAVDITTESGEMFLGVEPGNKITFQEAGTGNDVELYLTGATIDATSKFHVSCSDDDMNGTEDCGTNQGDGKGTNSGYNNDWLFDGMTGEDGSFDCELPNTGVVDPEAGGGPSTGNVTGESTLDLSDDKVKWKLTNNGTQDVFITRVMVTWPAGHEEVKKFKLDGDFAKDVFDGGGSTVVPDDKAFESDASKRRLKVGDDKNLEIEFTEKSKDHVQGDYTIKVDFDNGQVLTFNIP